MSRASLRLGVFLLAMLVAVAMGYSAVSGTRHDLSSGGGITDKSTNEDEKCVFCHTPHQANPSAPLWNHTLATTATYGTYSSSTLDATPTDIGGGTAVSNLCMSCHDGSVAVNSLVNPPNDIGANPTMGSGTELNASFQIDPNRATNLGTVLSNDHPINFTYDAALATADGELNTPFSTSWVDAANTVPLFAGSVQCASCHDPHDATNSPFLVKSNANSDLCTTCHVK